MGEYAEKHNITDFIPYENAVILGQKFLVEVGNFIRFNLKT